MKNLFPLFLKINKTLKKAFMLMLLVNILAPFGSKAQSNFTCSFENLDEEYVIESGSIVTATITYTYTDIEAIKLTFPNTFEIINPPNGNYYDLLEGSSFGDVLPTGALRTFEFLVSSSPIVVSFAYRGCNVSGNSASENTNNLFFDCSGGPTANINLYSADIVNSY